MWIEELKSDLTGKQLAIWLGKNDDGTPLDMKPELQQEYRKQWLMQAVARKGKENPNKGVGFRKGDAPKKRDCGCGRKKKPS